LIDERVPILLRAALVAAFLTCAAIVGATSVVFLIAWVIASTDLPTAATASVTVATVFSATAFAVPNVSNANFLCVSRIISSLHRFQYQRLTYQRV
jgi:hypothetical protein